LPQLGQLQAYLLGGANRCMSVPHRHLRMLYGAGSIRVLAEVIASC
jgi:hypothetical protein